MSSNGFNSRLQALPARWRRRIYWTLALLLTYTVVGFLVLPPIVRAIAVKQLHALFDREVSIESVRINPFVLSGSIRGLLIKDKDGAPFLSWDEAYANFQLSSFFGKHWVFREVRLARPYARIQVNPDRSFNFSDLLEKFSRPGAAPQTPAQPLYLSVGRLQITNAVASLADLTMRTPFRRKLGPLTITLTEFHTDPAGANPYTLTGITDGGEILTWKGVFHLSPPQSEGEFAVTGISLQKYAPLYQDLVRFEIKDGVMDLSSAYRLNLDPTHYTASLSNAEFSLRSFQLASPGAATNTVELDRLAVSGIAADAVKRTVDIKSVLVDGGRLAAARNREEKFNVVELAQPAETATNAPGSIMLLMQAATNAMAFLLESTNQASLVLHQLDVTNCAVSWDDLANRRPVHLLADQIAVTGRELSNHTGSNMTAQVSLRWNTNGTIGVGVAAQLFPTVADVSLALKDIDLGPLDSYLEPFVNLFIIRSKVGLDGKIHLEMPMNKLPEVTFAGDLSLDDFATVDGVMTEDLVKWKSVRFSGIEAKLSPPEVAVREIALLDPYASVTVETNRIINVLAALKMAGTNTPATPAKPVAAAPAGGRAGLEKQFGGFIQSTLAAGTNGAGTGLTPKLTVSTVVISNATLELTDRSIAPRVGISLDELNGTITGLSSEELKRADLHLAGKMDHASPVVITGHINPLNPNTHSDLKISLQDLDLNPAGPYVGKYAGYSLVRGKLSLDLNYDIAGRKLAATNLVTLDQFTLGQKVDSPDATKLPVRLAIAILKDRQGKIELDVPVEGSLDDPEFRLGRVITRAILNVITKIVTSPFAALSAVFGGQGEELSFQEFAPGSAILQTNDVVKLDTLAKGLYERPGLSVEIEGSVDPDTDGAALARQKLEHEFRVTQWEALRGSMQTQVTPDEMELNSAEFQNYIQQKYAREFPPGTADTNAPATSAPAASGARRPDDSAKGAQRMVAKGESVSSAAVDQMEQQLLAHIAISADDFRQLADRRASSVKDYLLQTGKVEAGRIFFTTAGSTTATNGSRALIHFR